MDLSRRHTLTHFFSLFLFIWIFLFVAWSQMPGRVKWVRRRRSAATSPPEAHASVSLCYKSFRDTQKGHNTFLPSFSHPSILSPSFIIECGSSEHPICRTARSKQERRRLGWGGGGETNKIRGQGEKLIKWEEKKKRAVPVWFHTGIKCLKAKVPGSFMYWIMDLLYFLIVRLLVDNSRIYCVLVL